MPAGWDECTGCTGAILNKWTNPCGPRAQPKGRICQLQGSHQSHLHPARYPGFIPYITSTAMPLPKPNPPSSPQPGQLAP